MMPNYLRVFTKNETLLLFLDPLEGRRCAKDASRSLTVTPVRYQLIIVTFYVAMAAAAVVVEGIFGVLGLVPHERQARVVEAMITWNYTT
jgi:ABC-type Fe3+-siderophore transport system permease subunit